MPEQQASEWYMYDETQGFQTLYTPSPPSPHPSASFIRPPSPAPLPSLNNNQDHTTPHIEQQQATPHTPPTRSSYAHQSQPRIQSQSPHPSHTTHDTSDDEEPFPPLASGRSSLGDISRPGSVISVGVSRNGVRGRRGPSQSPHPRPPFRSHGRGSSSFDSRIRSPSPGPSPVSEVEDTDGRLVVGGGAQRQTTGWYVAKGSIAYPHGTCYRMASPSVPSKASGPQEESLSRASMIVRNKPSSRDQGPCAPSSTCIAPALVSADMAHQIRGRGDYVLQPQIEMDSFISTSLPSPKPFRRIPTAEVVAKRQERYARLNSEIEDVEDGLVEGEKEKWWRKHLWMRWGFAAVVWGLLWFVVGGSLGFVMRRSGT